MTTVFGSLLRQNFRCGRMCCSRAEQVGCSTLCIVGKNGAVLLFCPGAIPIGSPGFFFIKK